MRILIISIFMVISACGRVEPTQNRLGEMRSDAQALITPLERSRISSICNALNTKSKNLSQAALLSLSYSVRQRECSEELGGLSAASSVAVAIEAKAAGYKINRVDNGQPFIYPNLETTQSGMMGIICTNLDEATNPIRLENGNALWVNTSQISATDCNPQRNEICILIETGTPTGNTYQIITKEWMKFQLDPLLPKLGFVTQRRTISSVFCALNQSSQLEALLED
jgi:hypothetical protein